MSVVSPRQHSLSDGNLFSAVASSESHGTFHSHAPFHDLLVSDIASGDSSFSLPVSSEDLVFPHHLAFGDSISSLKDEHIFWVGFCNIGGFPAMSSPNAKAQELKHFMALHDIDLFGSCEANLNWSRSSESMRLQEWFQDLPSCCTYMAHNINEQASLKQYGGTFWIGTWFGISIYCWYG